MASKNAKEPSTGPDAPEALEELKALFKFMQDNGLERFELNRKDYHVRLVRQGRPSVPFPVPVPIMGPGAPLMMGPGAPMLPPAAGHAPAPAAPALPPNATVMKAPLMGIFYRAASPSSPPFVKEGDAIKPGDVLCLIEAMKVFNDVKAEIGGVIVRVCVENGKPVKAGQDIFVIEKR
ncbi:MAG: biotin carboxyl carrier domain-containing protein [Elusimicrobia bacterium]|nr:biotin carboxyl carrier domain-containing protein [Elusimicrobiota bacterium]